MEISGRWMGDPSARRNEEIVGISSPHLGQQTYASFESTERTNGVRLLAREGRCEPEGSVDFGPEPGDRSPLLDCTGHQKEVPPVPVPGIRRDWYGIQLLWSDLA